MADVAERLALIRKEAYGERGRSEFARALGIPLTSYLNYENGRVPPIEVVVKMMALTRVNPQWLLHGKKPQYLTEKIELPATENVASLLSELLQENARLRDELLKTKGAARPAVLVVPQGMDSGTWLAEQESIRATADQYVAVPILSGKTAANPPDNVFEADSNGWALFPRSVVKHPKSTLAMRIQDDAMEPAVPKGALVGIDASVRDPQQMWQGDRRLVAMRDGKSGCIVRWLEKAEVYWVFLATDYTEPAVESRESGENGAVVDTVVSILATL